MCGSLSQIHTLKANGFQPYINSSTVRYRVQHILEIPGSTLGYQIFHLVARNYVAFKLVNTSL